MFETEGGGRERGGIAEWMMNDSHDWRLESMRRVLRRFGEHTGSTMDGLPVAYMSVCDARQTTGDASTP